MANNFNAPPLSPSSKKGSMVNRGHPSFANINSSNNLSPSLSPPSSPIFVTPSESYVPSQELNEQMEPRPDVVAFTNMPSGMLVGSENNPKTTMEFPISSTLISQEREDFLKPIILIIPAGANIVNTIINFSRDRDVSIVVHNASGLISEVNICNSLSLSENLSFLENSYMFSLSGFYTKSLSPSPPKNIPFSFFNIQFSRGMNSQIFGGLVGSKLIAAEPVQVMASIIKKHEYYNMMHLVTSPNVQPVMENTCVNCHAAIASNALSGITDNTINYSGFSIGASTSSSMNGQFLAAPSTATDVNMLYNNPTN